VIPERIIFVSRGITVYITKKKPYTLHEDKETTRDIRENATQQEIESLKEVLFAGK
jgi:hypothetical protein